VTDAPVDIYITVFRRPDYVGAAIESVQAQTYPHWRLRVSEDGGRTEPVAAVVQPFLTDERIRYASPDRRLGNADHKTALVADGDAKYVAILDDDDLWEPEWLSRRVAFLEQHPECVLVWAGHIDVDAVGDQVEPRPLLMADGVHSSREFVAAMLKENLIATPSILFRRDAYVSAGNAFDPEFIQINDYELWLRLGLQGPVGFLALHDSRYRVHPEQTSRRHRRALDHYKAIDHFDRLIADQYPDLRLAPSALTRAKADGLLSVALDASEQGDLRLAASRIAGAVRLDPRVLLSRRGLGAVAATVGGSRIRRRIAALRP
jgi:glycosyltransferase involved in cell wall biosynthesis